jgi:hypothetical protein
MKLTLGELWLSACPAESKRSILMAEVVQGTQQEFWRSPSPLEPSTEAALPVTSETMAEACADCGTEFMIGARFCHTCGLKRAAKVQAVTDSPAVSNVWIQASAKIETWSRAAARHWNAISFPDWVRYLHFHEIQRIVGLPTASLIAFIIGLGCVAGAISVSLFYKASNLPEFQAIQMWRIEWLLAATASFVAGILLKGSSNRSRD